MKAYCIESLCYSLSNVKWNIKFSKIVFSPFETDKIKILKVEIFYRLHTTVILAGVGVLRFISWEHNKVKLSASVRIELRNCG